MKNRIVTAVMFLWVLAAAGCYQSPDITLYDAGVYKGKADPLLDKLQQSGLQQQLQDRFLAVQTDR